MKRKLTLLILGVLLFLIDDLFGSMISTHESIRLMLIFFVVQSYVLIRIDEQTEEEIRISMNILKIAIRLLSALAFVFYLILEYPESTYPLAIQFIALYLVFMTFDIIAALSNLRRN